METGGKTNLILARRLRAHRESQRLSGPALAERLGVAQSTISKVENALLVPTIDYLSRFSHALRLDREQTQELVRLAGVFPADSQPADFLQFLPYDFLNVDWPQRRQRAMTSCENAAKVIRGYQPFLIPGLLQTAAYARHVFRLAGVTHPRRLDRGVAARLERQRILVDGSKRLVFLITEFALAARIGTKAERDEQVRRLLDLAQRPNIRIGLVPARKTPVVLPPPSFYLFDAERVYLELPHGDLWLLPSSNAAVIYLALFRRLAATAMFGRRLATRLQHIRQRISG